MGRESGQHAKRVHATIHRILATWPSDSAAAIEQLGKHCRQQASYWCNRRGLRPEEDDVAQEAHIHGYKLLEGDKWVPPDDIARFDKELYDFFNGRVRRNAKTCSSAEGHLQSSASTRSYYGWSLSPNDWHTLRDTWFQVGWALPSACEQ